MIYLIWNYQELGNPNSSRIALDSVGKVFQICLTCQNQGKFYPYWVDEKEFGFFGFSNNECYREKGWFNFTMEGRYEGGYC